MPANDHPEAFGQHTNADISTYLDRTDKFLGNILLTEPAACYLSAITPNVLVVEIINKLKSQVLRCRYNHHLSIYIYIFKVPLPLTNIIKFDDNDSNLPLIVVLMQEIARFCW